MFEQSPSGGWRAVQQVMERIRPRNRQERAVLRHLHESGSQSLFSLRETVNTGQESLFRTISRLEDRGFVYARNARHVEITDDGRTALDLLRERGGATSR